LDTKIIFAFILTRYSYTNVILHRFESSIVVFEA